MPKNRNTENSIYKYYAYFKVRATAVKFIVQRWEDLANQLPLRFSGNMHHFIDSIHRPKMPLKIKMRQMAFVFKLVILSAYIFLCKVTVSFDLLCFLFP